MVTNSAVAPRERLNERLKTLPPPVHYHNLDRIGLDDDVVSEIRDCLMSNDHQDINTGLYVLGGLLQKHDLAQLGSPFISYLIKRVPALLEHDFPPVVYGAMGWFATLKENYPNYREKM